MMMTSLRLHTISLTIYQNWYSFSAFRFLSNFHNILFKPSQHQDLFNIKILAEICLSHIIRIKTSPTWLEKSSWSQVVSTTWTQDQTHTTLTNWAHDQVPLGLVEKPSSNSQSTIPSVSTSPAATRKQQRPSSPRSQRLHQTSRSSPATKIASCPSPKPQRISSKSQTMNWISSSATPGSWPSLPASPKTATKSNSPSTTSPTLF